MQQFDYVTDFCDQVFEFIAGRNRPRNCFLVRKHSEDLQSYGDFSFPISVKAWHAYLKSDFLVDDIKYGNILQTIGKSENQIIDASKHWRLSILKVEERIGRLHLFLNRTAATSVGFQIIDKTKAFIQDRLANCQLQIENSGDDVTSLRVDFLNETLKSVWRIVSSCKEIEPPAIVTKRLLTKCDSCIKNIVCGPVLNAKNSTKETTITKVDYVRMRREELTLIAQHRYGLRLSKDSRWNQLIEELGVAVAKFELLQTKPSSPVKISFENSVTGANKGPAFVLYNCARMETIRRTFNEKVEQKVYPKLPSFEEIDLSLLTQEEEWNLIFNYMLGFPTMLTSCLEISEKCDFRPQLICNFLYSFVKIFSQYYRKTRILTEPRTHLLPVLFARIYLINAMCTVMQDTLRILGIKHVPHM